MNLRHTVPSALLACCLLLYAALTLAQEEPRIGELSYLDKQFMAQQRALLEEMTTLNFGRRFNGQRDNDLELLQMLLDKRLVLPQQKQELQAMGVILGDLLAAELNLRWVIYEDKLGRSRALFDESGGTYLFPISMISRRREADNLTPVTEIYARASSIVTDNRPRLPYQ
jgi:hypothetical protein